jgi:hypothetical protein
MQVLSTINKGFFLVIIAIVVSICMLVPHAEKFHLNLSLIDFLYASLTLLFLGGLLFKSFEARKLYAVAYVSMGIIFLAVYAQLLPLLKIYFKDPSFYELHRSVIFLSSQSLMVGIFVSLAFSWVIENSEIVKEIKEDEIATAFLDRYGDSPEQVEKRLGEMLEEDQLYYVILIAKEFYQRKGQTKDLGMLHSLSALSGRLTSLKVAQRNGTISVEDYGLERNKIHDALLDIIDAISQTK